MSQHKMGHSFVTYDFHLETKSKCPFFQNLLPKINLLMALATPSQSLESVV